MSNVVEVEKTIVSLVFVISLLLSPLLILNGCNSRRVSVPHVSKYDSFEYKKAQELELVFEMHPDIYVGIEPSYENYFGKGWKSISHDDYLLAKFPDPIRPLDTKLHGRPRGIVEFPVAIVMSNDRSRKIPGRPESKIVWVITVDFYMPYDIGNTEEIYLRSEYDGEVWWSHRDRSYLEPIAGGVQIQDVEYGSITKFISDGEIRNQSVLAKLTPDKEWESGIEKRMRYKIETLREILNSPRLNEYKHPEAERYLNAVEKVWDGYRPESFGRGKWY